MIEQRPENQRSQEDHEDQGQAGRSLIAVHPDLDGSQLPLLLEQLRVIGVHGFSQAGQALDSAEFLGRPWKAADRDDEALGTLMSWGGPLP